MESEEFCLEGEEAVGCLRLRPNGWLIDRWEDLAGETVTLFHAENPQYPIDFRFPLDVSLGVVCARMEDGGKRVSLSQGDTVLDWVEIRLRVPSGLAAFFEPAVDPPTPAFAARYPEFESPGGSSRRESPQGKKKTLLFGVPAKPSVAPPSVSDDDSWG